MEYGLQLYSVRDFAEKDYRDTLRQVAEIGYKKVETGGWFDHSPKEIRAWADEFDLEICSAHCGLDELENDFDRMVQAMKDLRCTEYVIPWAFWLKPEWMDKNIDAINKFQPMLAAEGINLSFHNHRDEFVNVEGRVAIEEMYNRTNINLEVDTFWAFAAGQDPVEVLKKYGDRIKMIHLKDGVKKVGTSDEDDFEGRPLGTGEAPVDKVYKYACEKNLIAIVESENLNPDGITEVKNCYNFLQSVK